MRRTSLLALAASLLVAPVLGVVAADAEKFLRSLKDASVDLFLIDPPYYKIVRDLWDHQWESPEQYASWLVNLCTLAREKVKPNGSLVMFQAIGKHGQHLGRSPSTAVVIDDRVSRDLVDPCVKPRRVLEARELVVDLHEDLLEDVLRVLGASDPTRDESPQLPGDLEPYRFGRNH